MISVNQISGERNWYNSDWQADNSPRRLREFPGSLVYCQQGWYPAFPCCNSISEQQWSGSQPEPAAPLCSVQPSLLRMHIDRDASGNLLEKGTVGISKAADSSMLHKPPLSFNFDTDDF